MASQLKLAVARTRTTGEQSARSLLVGERGIHANLAIVRAAFHGRGCAVPGNTHGAVLHGVLEGASRWAIARGSMPDAASSIGLHDFRVLQVKLSGPAGPD